MLIGAAVWFGVMVYNEPRPDVGNCLASMEGTIFGGMEIVDCTDPTAKYQVVAYKATGTASEARSEVCDGHPGGQSYVDTGKRQRLNWAICAVPL